MRSFFKNIRGTAAIEFSLAAPIMLLLLSGIVNLGIIIAQKNQLAGIVSVGLLYAFGNNSSPSLVQSAMTSSTNLTPLTATATSLCICVNGTQPGCAVNCPDGKLPSKYVTVTASSQINLVSPVFVIQNPFPISIQGTIRVP